MQWVSKLIDVAKSAKTVREHFFKPENGGSLIAPTGRGKSSNAACGDELQIDVEIVDGRVQRILFLARACSAVIGTASLITSVARGLRVEAARQLDVAGLVQQAGGVPPSKLHAPRMVERALRAALAGEEEEI